MSTSPPSSSGGARLDPTRPGEPSWTPVSETSESLGPTPAVLVAGAVDPAGVTGLALDLGFLTRLGVRGGPLVATYLVRAPEGVRRAEAVAPDLFAAGLEAALESLGDSLRAIKAGLCVRREHADALARVAAERGLPLVVDPVMRSAEGQAYAAADPLETLAPLVASATLLGLDAGRAAALAPRFGGSSPPPSRRASPPEALLAFARALAGPERTVVVSADPADAGLAPDGGGFCAAIAGPAGERIVDAPAVARGLTAGTGDALAATAAGYIALGLPPAEAAAAAHRFVARALAGSRATPGTPLSPEPWAI